MDEIWIIFFQIECHSVHHINDVRILRKKCFPNVPTKEKLSCYRLCESLKWKIPIRIDFCGKHLVILVTGWDDILVIH